MLRRHLYKSAVSVVAVLAICEAGSCYASIIVPHHVVVGLKNVSTGQGASTPVNDEDQQSTCFEEHELADYLSPRVRASSQSSAGASGAGVMAGIGGSGAAISMTSTVDIEEEHLVALVVCRESDWVPSPPDQRLFRPPRVATR